ncbi:hypothetical protein GLAREA_04820 [Glarea lozoyensis ATCC 20868]|uniref:Uncharacterized protein n=1 Tax=Glarea lozoyensis (strain ATCC 20868 / MF5171) TaxID=1116229 RepID=S3CSH9_GLAL2|nr:uncharacterized protein GLAREA_04820 [Glarea lozoyensis ATCC 20868]EPE28029.1 hypothetical protein GLAREA_04820 [Glarea lozoyensis ATCC 20868]
MISPPQTVIRSWSPIIRNTELYEPASRVTTGRSNSFGLGDTTDIPGSEVECYHPFATSRHQVVFGNGVLIDPVLVQADWVRRTA